MNNMVAVAALCVLAIRCFWSRDHTPPPHSSLLYGSGHPAQDVPAQAAHFSRPHARTYDACDSICLQEERASWELMDPEDRPKFMPQAFDSLRHVSGMGRTGSLTNVSSWLLAREGAMQGTHVRPCCCCMCIWCCMLAVCPGFMRACCHG